MNCYLCNKNKLKIIRTRIRNNIIRNVYQCQNCKIVYLEPNAEDYSKYYESEYRKSYSPNIGKELNSQEIFNTYLPIQKERIDKIKHILKPEMKVLDIGCSAGHFLYAIKGYVKECLGIELNKENAQFANSTLGIKVFDSPIEKTAIPKHYFDIITIWQVLEHVNDPRKFLAIISNYLSPNGYLCIEVPNINDALLSLYKMEAYAEFWYREPHVFYYSPETLEMLLDQVGFTGEIQTTQEYNIINHINWILNGEPQKSYNVGTTDPEPINNESIDPKVKDEVNRWFITINNQYKLLLEKLKFGENILCIGKKHYRKYV